MTLYDLSAKLNNGRNKKLADYKGKVLLIVNTASKCGFTPQYAGLEALHEKLNSSGFSVLGFPCNQFGRQEPGSESEIGAFCTRNYGVSFPMFAKVDVNGANAHPLFRFLTREKPGIFGTQAVKWNFTKFLIGREGHPVARYAPMTKPENLEGAMRKIL